MKENERDPKLSDKVCRSERCLLIADWPVWWRAVFTVFDRMISLRNPCDFEKKKAFG